jgi:hypothetical protein
MGERRQAILILLIVLPLMAGVIGVAGVLISDPWPPPGSPAAIKEFREAWESRSMDRMQSAAFRSFIHGATADRYQSLLENADSVKPSVFFPGGTEFEFAASDGKGSWCKVTVVVEGDPPTIGDVSTFFVPKMD